ncbi:hypothetical protein [Acaricomes phytoseiuli]|uniref:hypothetical protein n=1 Tax=Acaricomes phytoseiuli TaxID=291968 RepID=UPI00036E39E9|nr:hypothetical protein [Acaricomes phytoseiuli]
MTADLKLTEGVLETDDGHAFPELGIWVSSNDPNKKALLVEYGFASEMHCLRLRSRSRAARLKSGLFPAIAQSVIHNALGLGRTLAGLVTLTITGLVLNISSFVAISAATALFFLSVLVHEAGHVAALRYVAPTETGVLVSRGWTFHLVRPTLNYRQEIAVITTGPLAPLIATIIFIPALIISPPIFYFWLALGLGHALLLLAPIGDGANLRNLRNP